MDENSYRLIFRPTQIQLRRFNKLMESGKYKHNSELLRAVLNIGLDKLENEVGVGEEK